MIELVDLSAFQAEALGYAKIAESGVVGAFVKATDGLHSPDKAFAAHVAGLRGAGVLTGAYHYLRVRHGQPQDAIAQADEFCNLYVAQGCELLPALDCEDTGNEHATPEEWLTAIRAFVQRVLDRIGCRPIVYTYPYFWRGLGPGIAGAVDIARCPLWIADYSGRTAPVILRPWSDWVCWQYTDAGSVSGIPGHVDRSCSREPLSELTRPDAADAVVGIGRAVRSVVGPLTPDDDGGPPAAA